MGAQPVDRMGQTEFAGQHRARFTLRNSTSIDSLTSSI
jgi:hypothetical protein